MNHHRIVFLSFLAFGFSASQASALDGKALYTTKLCNTCHGDEGKKPLVPAYPKIAGQSKEYIGTQIKDIKSGKRNNGMAAVMKPMVESLKDDEIEAIATYLSGVK